jgi:hypothetical protein
MRRLQRPTASAEQTYDLCVSTIADTLLRGNFAASRENILGIYEHYNQLAQNQQLHVLEPFEGNDDALVVGRITKGDLKRLYTQQLAGRGKPARVLYDQILASAPLGRCPYCGFGQVSTLDHFLAKAKFPRTSVLPINLVPSCKDCNHGKRAVVARVPAEQVIHPYFETAQIEEEQWLFAAVQETVPVSVIYRATPPAAWNDALQSRASNQLKDFDLPRRFALEAANEIAGLTPLLHSLAPVGEQAVREHLKLVFQNEFSLKKNSWRTALYQALANSDWFCGGGYAGFVQ